MRGSMLVLCLAVALVGCAGDDAGGAGSGGSAGATAGGSGGANGGGGGAGGTGLGGGPAGGAGAGGYGGAAGDAGCDPPPKPLAPGEPLSSGSDAGGGACLGTTLAQFLAEIHAAHPELADITQIYTPDLMYDGSFVYPYRKPDGTFAVVFKRGAGDCPAGCTENE